MGEGPREHTESGLSLKRRKRMSGGFATARNFGDKGERKIYRGKVTPFLNEKDRVLIISSGEQIGRSKDSPS